MKQIVFVYKLLWFSLIFSTQGSALVMDKSKQLSTVELTSPMANPNHQSHEDPASSFFDRSAQFSIQAISSHIEANGKRVNLKANWGEISRSLNSQRLYDLEVVIEEPHRRIEVKAKQARFKDKEIIFMGETQILITSTKQMSPLNLNSKAAPVVLDLSANMLSSSIMTARYCKNLYEGKGFQLDLTMDKILWISQLEEQKTHRKFATPYSMNLTQCPK